MAKFKDFLKQYWKFLSIILIVIIIIIIVISVFINKKKFESLDVYKTLEYNYFSMYSIDDKVGVINTDGKIIIEPIYTDIYIPNPEKDVFFCYLSDSEYEILNSNKEELFTDYENVSVLQTSELSLDFEKYVLRYEQDGKYGLINFDGEVVVSAIYDSISSLQYKPGELLVKKDEKYGVLTSNGEIKIKIEYDSIVGDEYNTESESYNLTGYIVGTKTDTGYLYGYLNNSGKKVLDVSFESITRVLKYDDTSSYLIVMNNGKKGVYKDDEKLIEQNYQSVIYAESSNVFVVKRNSKYGIFSTSGKVILSVEYVGYSLAGDYISVQNEDGSKELYDVNGNKISNLNYTSVQSAGSSGCYIAIDENGYYSIISKSDTISNNYTYISYAFENYFIFKDEDGYYGLLNIYSGVQIEPEYTLMLVVDGKNAIEAEKDDGTVDIYSSKIEKTVSIENAIVENIDEDYARVYSNSDMEYINKNGEKVENTAVYKSHKLYSYSENDKWGFKNSSGEIIVQAEYDFVTELNEYGFAGILNNGKWGVINSDGKVVVECNFEIETYYLPSFIGEYLLELTDTYHVLMIK